MKRTIFSLMLMLLMVIATVSAVTWDDQYGTFAYWKQEEGSGAMIDTLGTYNTGGCDWGTTTGILNNARVKTGANSCSLGDVLGAPQFGSKFSVSLWIYPTAYPGINMAGALSKWQSSTSTREWGIGPASSNRLQFQVRSASGTYMSAQTANGYGATNTWYHMVGVYNGTNIILYVNGVKQQQAAGYGAILDTNSPLVFGWGDYDYYGRVDEVTIAAEQFDDGGCAVGEVCGGAIALLYNSGTPLSYEALQTSLCTPDWACNGYAACLTNDTQVCNSVVDNNACGDSYSGDYSEFTPQACDYCTPSWSCSDYTDCIGKPYNHKDCNAVTDANDCYATTGLPSDNFAGSLSSYTTDCSVTGGNQGGAIAAQQNAQKASAAATNKPSQFAQVILNLRAAILRLFGITP